MFYKNEINPGATTPTRARYAWHELEEHHPNGGMWATPAADKRPAFIAATAALMRNPAAFREAIREAFRAWPRSAAQALTTPGLNQRAWAGHAGCYLATGSPEETTRLGWHDLDDAEQRAANAAADAAIAAWRATNEHQPPLFGGPDA